MPPPPHPSPSRVLVESGIEDMEGELRVGGSSGSFFMGALQDVRVYAASLDQR